MSPNPGFEQTVLDVCASLTTALTTRQVVLVGPRGSGRSTLCERVVAHPVIRQMYGSAVLLTKGDEWWDSSLPDATLNDLRNSEPALLIVDDIDVALSNSDAGKRLHEFLFGRRTPVALLATSAPRETDLLNRAFGPRLRNSIRHYMRPPNSSELARILNENVLLLEMCHVPYDPAVVELASAVPDDEFDDGPAHPRLGIDRLDRWGAHAKALGCSRVTVDSLPTDDRPRSEMPKTQFNRNFDRNTFVSTIGQRVIGQHRAVEQVADLLDLSSRGMRLRGTKHLGAVLLVGRSGVGKTSLVEAVCEALHGELVRLDGSEFADEASRNCLVGAPPAYVGYNDGGSLPSRINAANERAGTSGPVILLVDELEKANRDVQLLFLQAMEGRLTDSSGEVADFSKTLFMMSSNLTASRRAAGFVSSSDAVYGTIETLKKELPPELIGRFDLIIEFDALSRDSLRTIAQQELATVCASLEANGYELHVEPEVFDCVIESGFDPALGARLLHRSIERRILAPLARRQPGAYRVSVGEDGDVQFEAASGHQAGNTVISVPEHVGATP